MFNSRNHTGTQPLALAIWLAVMATACGAPARDAGDPLLSEAAPDSFSIAFETSSGAFRMRLNLDWSPAGVDRIYELRWSHWPLTSAHGPIDALQAHRVTSLPIERHNIPNGFFRFSSGNVTKPPTRCDSNTATIISVAARAS